MSLAGLRLLKNIKKCVPLSVTSTYTRCISTSKKNRDTATVAADVQEPLTLVNKKKDWVSYGFSIDDYDEDRHFMHMTAFMGITVVFIFGGFILAYRPDDLMADWAQREAFLELRRRERNGLPLVDPNYLPVDEIILPTDEELGDTEICI